MRSIDPDITAAQKLPKRVPYLKAVVTDRLAGVNRLRRTNWYTGAEPDNGHAAVVAADGSLIRVRTDGTNIYRSRVTTPTSGSDYSVWTLWGSDAKAHTVALCKAGSKLWCLIAADSIPTRVYASTSTDNGATWSSFSLQFTHPVTIAHIAAAGKSNGDVVVVVNEIAGDTGGVTAWRYNGATWANKGTSPSAADLTLKGLAAFHALDYNVIATGYDDDDDTYHVRTLVFGDGYSAAVDTWSTTTSDIVSAITASNIQYHRPYAARPDTNRVTFRQIHTATVAYDRNAHTQQPATMAFIDDLWREPVPTDLDAPYGIAISYDDDNVFFTTARWVYHSPTTPASLDLTADVVEAVLHEIPLNPKLSHIIIDNASGKYDSPGSGDVAALTKGADVELSPGYLTANGNKASQALTYNIQALEHTYQKGRALLTLHLGSPWTHLARHRFPRALTVDEDDLTVFQQLAYIAARVGFEFTSSGGSTESANLYPPLIIQPGTSALAAFRAILDRIPDHIVTRTNFFYLNEPLAADSADADYKRPISDGDQEIASATYRDALKDANHIQIFGDDDAAIVAEDLDAAEAELHYSAPRQRADVFLDSGAEATDRATREQRQQAILTTRRDELLAPVHCGLETNDVIAITDTPASLTDAKRRVLTLRLDYRRGPRKARYDQTIQLGAP